MFGDQRTTHGNHYHMGPGLSGSKTEDMTWIKNGVVEPAKCGSEKKAFQEVCAAG